MSKDNTIQLYDEEVYESVCNVNKDILEEYILDMKSRRLKEGSIYQYTKDIMLFYCYVCTELKNKPIPTLKKKQFKRFFIDFQNTGVSNARVNRVQCSLRNLMEFVTSDDDMVDEYDAEVNYMAKIKGLQKEEVREIIFLSDDEIRLLIDELVKDEKYQIALLVALAYESAGRRNELYQVTKSSLLDEEDNKTNVVVGKRGKKFFLRYFSKTKEILKLYLEQRGEDDKDFLWYKKNSKGEVEEVGYSTLYGWIIESRAYLEKAVGEHKLFNPHSFRHSSLENLVSGTHWILPELGKECLTLEEAKLLAHHADSSTTAGYIINRDTKEEDNLFGV